jgi:hypothetical protein
MGLPKFNEKFVVTAVYNNGNYEYIEPETVEIKINKKVSEEIFQMKILENLVTSFNFDDIVMLIIDIIAFNGDIKVRKTLTVDFVSYHQVYDILKSHSTITIDFEISNLEIYQDDDLLTLESLIRNYKIKNITDIN